MKNERLLFRGNEILTDYASAKSVEEMLAMPIVTKRDDYKQQGEFIMGPIPIVWITAAATISGAAAHLALILWHLVRMRQEPVALSYAILQRYSIRQRQGRRLVRALEAAGLITVERGTGRTPRVRIVRQKPT